MRNRLISTAVIALCVCLSACGIQEEVIPEEPAEQGDIIAEGSGNDAPDGGTQAAEPEDIADPGESGQTDENALSPDSLPVLETGTLSECITLCQLDGLKVSITLEEDPDAEDALIYARLLKDAKPLLDPESGIRPGDVVSIDMYAVEDGDKDLTRLGVSVLVGAGTQPEEIEDALIGMRRDEEKKVTVTYPEDYLFMGLGGRTVRYRICVRQSGSTGIGSRKPSWKRSLRTQRSGYTRRRWYDRREAGTSASILQDLRTLMTSLTGQGCLVRSLKRRKMSTCHGVRRSSSCSWRCRKRPGSRQRVKSTGSTRLYMV